MCFSATASFASMAVLTPCGVAACQLMLADHRELLPLAAMPLFFGLQQGLEGLVWTQQNVFIGTRAAALLYLSFALFFWLIWPSLVPYQLCCRRWRRWLCVFTSGLGAVVGCGL